MNCCFGIFDLIFFGVGIIIGVGLYVLIFEIVCKFIGLSVVVLYFIVVFVLVLVGLCYVEFGCCVFKVGLVYVYSYLIMGEFCVFIIGWDLILEYSIGFFLVVKVISLYLDVFFDDCIKNLIIFVIGEIYVKGIV